MYVEVMIRKNDLLLVDKHIAMLINCTSSMLKTILYFLYSLSADL